MEGMDVEKVAVILECSKPFALRCVKTYCLNNGLEAPKKKRDKYDPNLAKRIVIELDKRPLEEIYGAGMRAFVHANADAQVDILLDAHKKYASLAGEDSRTVIIHSQFIRPDQLEDYARYGMVPAFFSNHAYYWGDVHLENLGKERAFFLSPMNSASELGIHFTNHSDYIVTPLDPLFTVWTAVNRLSRSGRVIGPAERITPWQALKAITLDGAWQYGEEDSKGSLSPGKLADLVVLDGNPLTVDPLSIKDIEILATYKEGELVYSARR